MSDDFWRNKDWKDRINKQGRYAPPPSRETMSPPLPVLPPQPTVNLLGVTMIEPDPNPQDKDERIQLLEQMLYEQWQIICEQALTGEARQRAFLSMDRSLRELGILPRTPGTTRKKK